MEGADRRMLLIDERKLTNGVISLIGECYGMKYDYSNYTGDSYDAFIDEVVERFYIGDKEEVIDFLKKI
jgi:hypothetical protein